MIGKHHEIKVVIPIAILCYGGTEVQTLHLLRVLKRNGCEVEVVCFYENYADIVKEYENNGATVTLLNLDKKKNKLKLFHVLYQFYRERCPDVVHVQYVQQGFIALAAALLAHVPIRFATVHQLGAPYGFLQHFLLRAAAQMATMFLCVSEAAERSWFGASSFWNADNPGLRRHCTIYNSIDIERINSLISSIDKDMLRNYYGLKKGPIVGIVGRTSIDKGQLVLIEACSIIAKSFPHVQILIVGEDHQRDEIMMKAAAVELQKNVVFTGRLPAQEVYKLYSLMDLLVVSSRFEGFGLTAAEAMAAGVPVVASRVGGLLEIVQDGVTGLHVEPQDPQELADALLKCLKNRDRAAQFGEAGKLRVKTMFSFDIYTETVTSLYQWAMEKSVKHSSR